jgi:carboxyl-terminal processing protease
MNDGSDGGVGKSVAKQGRQLSWGTAFGVLALVAVLSFILGTRFDSFDQLVSGPKSSSRLDFSSLNELYAVLKEKYDGELDTEKLIDGAKHGLIDAAGDPYTVYLNEEEAKAFDGDLNGTFEGIGAELSKVDGQLTIMSVIADSPAKRAGLLAKDVILKVNGEETSGLTVGEAVKKIRGEKGTSVKLTIYRGESTNDYDIVRDAITSPSVTSEILDGNVGYLRISRFGDDTTRLANAAAADFKSKGVSKVVLDLRGNGGGFLGAAKDVAGLWLKDKTIVSERRQGAVTDTLKSGYDAPLEGIKTVVLVDGASASASEIVAGALKDHGVATLVGEKTYGKGSVQTIQSVGNQGDQLKVTVAKWYTPNGKNIDKEGISPDVTVSVSDEDIKAVRDPQKDAALQQLR